MTYTLLLHSYCSVEYRFDHPVVCEYGCCSDIGVLLSSLRVEFRASALGGGEIIAAAHKNSTACAKPYTKGNSI